MSTTGGDAAPQKRDSDADEGAAELIYLVGLYCLVSVTLMGKRFTHKRSGMPSGFQSFRREGIAVGDVLLDGLE